MVVFEGGISQLLAFSYGRSDLIVKSQWESIVRRIKQKGDAERVEAMAHKTVTRQRINLGGLTPHEIEAQRVLLRTAVDQLPPAQSRAMNARYCKGWEQTGAISLLAPMLPKVSDTQAVQKLVVMAVYGLVSIREAARVTGTDRRVVTENVEVMRGHIGALETVAYGSLEAAFSGSGLID